MTDIKDIKTYGINQLTTVVDGGQQVLLIGLKEAYRAKPQYNRSLKREYDLNKELNNPHILKCIGFQERESFGNCLEMEWEDARNLTEYLAEGHSEDERKAVFMQIVDAISYLSDNKQVLADLNPGIVYVTKKDDVVKVINFRQRYVDNMNEPRSVLNYKAAEVRDETMTIDVRADLFSLAKLLKDFQLGSDYDHIIETNSNLGRGQRFSDINEFIDAMEHRRTSSYSTNLGGPGMDNKKKAMVMALVVVVIIIIASISFFATSKSNPADEEEVTQTDTESPDYTVKESADNNTDKDDASQQTQTQQNPAPTPAAAPTSPATQGETPAAAPAQTYTGENAYLSKLVPQMQQDINKIYQQNQKYGKRTIRKRVSAYYRGLRRSLGNLNQQQYAAFDKAFADYIQQKNQE